MHTLTNAVHALTDPVGFLVHNLSAVLAHFVASARDQVVGVLDRFLFRTVDPTLGGNRPITSNPGVIKLNFGLCLAVDLLMTLVVLFTSLRSMFERSLRSKYDLKVALPRVMLAIVLAHGSLLFMQMAVDLNNAVGSVAMSLGSPVRSDTVPWSASIAPATVTHLAVTEDLFHLVVLIALVVALVILVLAYVVRTALLNVLLVTAPLAALLSVLPDTRTHARSWLRLFLTTVFMQAVQLIVLRVAVTTAFDSTGGLISTVYALATLWLLLKVPGAMGTGAHLESKAHTMLHGLERTVKRAVMPHQVHHSTRKAA